MMSASQTVPEYFPADSDWAGLCADYFVLPEFRTLLDFVDEQRQTETIFPAAVDVFAAFRCCSFAGTSVVILGQDPYHGEGQAHGLSFSVKGDQKLPPSLKNVYKELQADVGCVNTVGNLTPWAEQGVLLLNTVLTVQSGAANSHRKRGWEGFTDHVIASLGQRSDPMVFILWGKPAAKRRNLIGQQHCVIESPHPSPLSAHRGFFGSKPFSRSNAALQGFGRQPIDWALGQTKH